MKLKLNRLIASGTNVEAADDSGRTPAHHAAELDSLEIMKVLGKAGADLTAAGHLVPEPGHLFARHWSAADRIAMKQEAKRISEGGERHGYTPADVARVHSSVEVENYLNISSRVNGQMGSLLTPYMDSKEMEDSERPGFIRKVSDTFLCIDMGGKSVLDIIAGRQGMPKKLVVPDVIKRVFTNLHNGFEKSVKKRLAENASLSEDVDSEMVTSPASHARGPATFGSKSPAEVKGDQTRRYSEYLGFNYEIIEHVVSEYNRDDVPKNGDMAAGGGAKERVQERVSSPPTSGSRRVRAVLNVLHNRRQDSLETIQEEDVEGKVETVVQSLVRGRQARQGLFATTLFR